METIDRLEAYCKIKETKGQIFSAFFEKKDKTMRKMVCRLGVKKGVKGVGMAYVPLEKRLVCVFDMQKNEFRMINLKTLQKLKISNAEYLIEEDRKCQHDAK